MYSLGNSKMSFCRAFVSLLPFSFSRNNIDPFTDSLLWSVRSKSEYVIYKLKEMGKVSEKDILQICGTFDRLDTGNCGKISLADLMESRQRL